MFLKVDADQARTDVEVEAMAMAPIPTPEVLWRKPPVLALAALPGTALGRDAQGGVPPSRPAGRKALAAARDGSDGSLAQSFLMRLKTLDFASQAMSFGAGLLVSLLPFVILLSAFAEVTTTQCR